VPELGYGSSNHCADRLQIGDIALNTDGTNAVVLAQASRCVVRGVFQHVGDGDVRAVLREPGAEPPAENASAAGDDGRLARQ
jgi:hypothetical protein